MMSVDFQSPSLMEEYLQEEEVSTEWYITPVSHFRFNPCQDDMSLTIEFDGGIASIYQEDNRVVETLLDRLQVEGPGIRNLPLEKKATVLNLLAENAAGDATVAVRDGRVVACLSAGSTENDFRPLSSSQVFEKTRSTLYSMCGDEEDYFAGRVENGYVSCTYTLPMEMMLNGVNRKVSVTMNTSDYGRSAVHFLAGLKCEGIVIPVYETKVLHRENNALNEIDERLSMLNKSIEDGTVTLESLKEIPIDNPANALKRIGKKHKLPKKSASKVIFDVEKGVKDGKSYSAYDLYSCMAEALKGYSESAKAEYVRHYTSSVLSLLGIDWKEYDLPGTFNW